MTIRLFTVVLLFFLVGCSVNPSLNSVKSRGGGVVADFNVLQFDDAPAVKPVSVADKSATGMEKGDYDFTLAEVVFREASYVDGKLPPSVKLVAKNRGFAPVSVSVMHDRDLSENMSTDTGTARAQVVPPRSEIVIARFDPRIGHASWRLAGYDTWSIGDFSARHMCPEGYRLPFPDGVVGRKTAPQYTTSTPYTRNAVVFSLPAGTQVLAARKGIVVRLDRNNDVLILHDDSTIATYSHLGAIAPGLRLGKEVKAGEQLGSVAESDGRSFLQLAVWRPEQLATNTLEPREKSDYQPVSFPLEFVEDAGGSGKSSHGRQTHATSASAAAATVSADSSKRGAYDFSLRDEQVPGSAYLPGSRAESRILAVNRGHAPVTVTFDLSADRTRNVRSDVQLPHTAVIPPRSERVLARLTALNGRVEMLYGCSYAWQLGDINSRHHSPDRYRFPFAKNVRAFASVPDKQEADPSIRHSVLFSLPVDSKVLAARSGIVVLVKTNNDIDVLHDDSTIATYRHLGNVDNGVYEGKHVSAGDVLGVAAKSEQPGKSFVQITVWRPEILSRDTVLQQKAESRVQKVSFPLEFCDGSNDCRVLTRNQQVSMELSGKRKSGRGEKQF